MKNVKDLFKDIVKKTDFRLAVEEYMRADSEDEKEVALKKINETGTWMRTDGEAN